MSDLPLGNVPISVLNDTDNIIFTEGQYAKKTLYSDMKTDMLGSAVLATTAQKPKEGINELVQGILDGSGYGVISGLTVAAQSTPNMTVNVASGILRTATGARQNVNGNSTLAITTADTTNPRIDIVYVDSTGTIQYLAGTANASPTVPTTPTGGFKVAEISVTANVTSISNANITDKRKILISTDALNTQLSDVVHQQALNTTNSNILNHTAKNVTDSGGVHGLAITNGTFTPIITDASTNQPSSYGILNGSFQKISNTVLFSLAIQISTKGTTMLDNAVRIGGLPYASIGSPNRYVSVNIGYLECVNCGVGKTVVGFISPTTNYINLVVANNDGSSMSNLTASKLANGSYIMVTGQYQV